jgi:hypothetical protein
MNGIAYLPASGGLKAKDLWTGRERPSDKKEAVAVDEAEQLESIGENQQTMVPSTRSVPWRLADQREVRKQLMKNVVNILYLIFYLATRDVTYYCLYRTLCSSSKPGL